MIKAAAKKNFSERAGFIKSSAQTAQIFFAADFDCTETGGVWRNDLRIKELKTPVLKVFDKKSQRHG